MKTPKENKPAKEKTLTLGAVQMSDWLGVTPRRLQQMAADGTISKPKARGEYSVEETVRGYVRFLQKTAEEGGSKQMHDERLRGLKLTNDRAEREELKNQGDLVPIKFAADILEALVQVSRTKIVSGFRKAGKVPDQKSRKILNDTLVEILSELAASDASGFASQLQAEALRAQGTNNG